MINLSNSRYKIYEIREIEAPNLNIWPLQTMSFPCSKDDKGRARLLLIDTLDERVLGLYYGATRGNDVLYSPLGNNVLNQLNKIVKW